MKYAVIADIHVNVSERAKLRAFAASNAPILDNDFQAVLPANGTHRTLRHVCIDEMVIKPTDQAQVYKVHRRTS